MKFTITVLILLYTGIITARAQNNYAVKGAVADTALNTKMDNATVCVLNAKDSILQKFTYTDKGAFAINNLKPGKLLLLITYPGYTDYVQTFMLDEQHPVFDCNISMILQSKLLKEVIIKGRVAAIKLKGDTTEFNAAAYATQKNAKVEDLLKQLQGMQVNQNGKITFQGQVVDKVLVDGEEFFGDDPTLVTRNIRADMVDKVQVYDRKSEIAKQTGVDDGVKLKTINIKLADDKNDGIFGKLEGDYGTDGYYGAQAMFNKFNTKEKFAAYANAGNTGKVGLSGDDRAKYGSFGSGGRDNLAGLPTARDAGGHYNTKWDKNKQSINTNYTIGSVSVDGGGNTQTQNNLPDNYNTSNNDNTFHYHDLSQGLTATYNLRIDSTSELFAHVLGNSSNRTSTNSSTTTTLRGNGSLLNTNSTSSNYATDSKHSSFMTNYTKRFKKKGRSLGLTLSTDFSDYKNNGDLKSNIKYYNEQSGLDSTRNIDQYKPANYTNNGQNASINYTEPLSKKLSVNVNYSFGKTESENKNLSFNKAPTGKYDIIDSAFSNNFKLTQITNNYTLGFNYNSEKFNGRISNSISTVDMKQKDVFADTLLSRNFVNWRPSANIFFKLSSAATLSVDYSGNTQQPGIYQLQPIKQNSDPLNINIGNPGLKPAFNNQFSFNYRLYQISHDRGINLSGSYSSTVNSFINNRTTDSAGINTYQWSNLKHRQVTGWSLYGELYSRIPKIDIVISTWISASGNISYNYINNQLNQSTNIVYSPRAQVAKYKPNYWFFIAAGPNYTVSKSSVQQQLNNNTYGFSADMGFYTTLPGKFFIGSDGSYQYNAKNQVFDRNFSKFLLKSYIGKSFLKDESLKASIVGNDILNQNTGYSRSTADGNFTETRNITIRRFFSLSVSWDFSKFSKVPQKQ